MKGTRSNHMSSLKSELSGEPILRPFTATSKFSGGNPSPTFDMNASMDNQSPNKYGEEAMQAAFGEMVIFNYEYNLFNKAFNILNQRALHDLDPEWNKLLNLINHKNLFYFHQVKQQLV